MKRQGDKETGGQGDEKKSMQAKIRSHRDLDVYKRAFATAMKIFHLSKRFPKEETFSLTDQGRRSSRSVCANLAEAWRKRRYQAAFISKLSDSKTEAAETQVWLEFALECNYLDRETFDELDAAYEGVIGSIVHMINHPESWVIDAR
jgi:four helix bundle protein